MSPLKVYGRLWSMAGAAFVIVAFLGRLPLAMSQLGTLLLVAGSTGSYAAGGVSAGLLAVANAVGAPVAGALADRLGQRPVVLVQSLGGASGLTGLVLLSQAGAGWIWLAATAALAGLVLPQVGPLARVRWRPIIGDSSRRGQLIAAAFSYEGAADEASFVLGPALVGAVVAVVSPAAALLAAAAILAVFGSWFALHPSAEAARTPVGSGPAVPLLGAVLVIFCLAQFAVGAVFGSVQTATSVLATAAGEPGLTGFLHALLGVGSVLAGLAVAMLPERFGYERRWRLFASGLLVLSLPLLGVDGLASLALVLLAFGLAIAPYMITVFTMAERVTPAVRTGAAMTLLAGATGLGYAAGAGAAGRLADWGGHTPAFVVTIAACACAVLLALTGGGRVRAELSAPRREQLTPFGPGAGPRPGMATR